MLFMLFMLLLMLLYSVGITGHSMGGHGALTIALKNPTLYKYGIRTPLCTVSCMLPLLQFTFSGCFIPRAGSLVPLLIVCFTFPVFLGACLRSLLFAIPQNARGETKPFLVQFLCCSVLVYCRFCCLLLFVPLNFLCTTLHGWLYGCTAPYFRLLKRPRGVGCIRRDGATADGNGCRRLR
jgi:hypothetical protein